jgi:alpha-tubulin suppressor-like RCC1 family protein
MTTNFRFNNGGTLTDFADAFIDRDIFSAGGLWGFGRGGQGQLGNNSATSRSSPVQTVAGGTNWKQVSSGYVHSAVIKTDGTLWTWGSNYQGALGDGTNTSRSSPVQTVASGTNWKQVSTGNNGTAAIKTDGTLWAWGSNNIIGDNTSVPKSSPVQTVAGGTNWKYVACLSSKTAAIKTDGTLWIWGVNNGGTLGDNTAFVDKSSPVQTIAGGTNWKQVSTSDLCTAAIKTDGTLWIWGSSSLLGTGNTGNRSSPVQTIAGGTNWQSVTCGYRHTAAIKTDGTLWTWGDAGNGELGDNTTVSKTSPVQTVAGGTNWKQVDASGKNYMSAIKTDGTLWGWGTNSSGELGDNTTVRKSSPVQTVAGGTNWKQVSGGYSHTLAISDIF